LRYSQNAARPNGGAGAGIVAAAILRASRSYSRKETRMRSARFKTALALGVLCVCGCAGGVGRTERAGHVMLAPDELQWKPAPPGLPAGAEAAAVEGDPAKPGHFALRLRAPDGYRIPPHWHSRAERLTVLSGTFNLGTGDRFDPSAARPLPPGGYAMLPPRMNHFAFAKGPVVVQVSGQGPFDIHYVDRADDPRGASAK